MAYSIKFSPPLHPNRILSLASGAFCKRLQVLPQISTMLSLASVKLQPRSQVPLELGNNK